MRLLEKVILLPSVVLLATLECRVGAVAVLWRYCFTSSMTRASYGVLAATATRITLSVT